MNWLKRWNRRDVECHDMGKGKVPAGGYPWLCVGKKLGAQVVVEVGGVDGWQVGCPLAGLVSDMLDSLYFDDDAAAEMLSLAEEFEAEAKRIREKLKRHNAIVSGLPHKGD